MDITHLKATHEMLIDYMSNVGYSTNYISLVKNTIEYVLNKPDNSWNSYDDVCTDYIGNRQGWEAIKRKSRINLIARYDVDGYFPDRKVHSMVFLKSAQEDFCGDFQRAIDGYNSFCKEERYRESTVKSRLCIGKTFFNRLQKKGCYCYSDVTEDIVLTSLKKEDGTVFSHRYCMIIRDILDHCNCQDNPFIQKIRSYIPLIPGGRKNIQYLTDAEVSDIKTVLDSKESGLSLRDKAVGFVLLYTGLRRSDIAGLTLSSVDWDLEVLNVIQQKTGRHVRVPLLPEVGNCIYDYLREERPITDSSFLFLTSRYPYRKLSAKRIAGISDRIYDVANIRREKGDRRGTHLFRHWIVSRMLECNVSQTVISDSLGHASPRSLDDYINSDFIHLKECALSVENFPLSKGVF